MAGNVAYNPFKQFISVVKANNLPKDGNEIRTMRQYLEKHVNDIGPIVSIKMPRFSRRSNEMNGNVETTTVLFIKLLDRSRSNVLLYLLNKDLYVTSERAGVFVNVGAKPIEWSFDRFDDGSERNEGDNMYMNETWSRSSNEFYEAQKCVFVEELMERERQD